MVRVRVRLQFELKEKSQCQRRIHLLTYSYTGRTLSKNVLTFYVISPQMNVFQTNSKASF